MGSVLCLSDRNGGSGHVAIVEEIASDGTITTSNSAYQGTYFWTQQITPVNGDYSYSHYNFQGFIYNPYADQPPIIVTGRKSNKFPWAIFTNIIRNKRTF